MRGDLAILALIESGRLRVDAHAGLVYAPKSNTPDKPIGCVTAKGYLRACINVGGKQMHFMVHRIVWVSVNGPVPKGHQVDHGDTDKQNNAISNLEAVTGRVNMARAKAAGLFRHVGRRDGVRDSKGRFGKKAAGRLLDGREWSEFPA
jgi:hypothetical protein